MGFARRKLQGSLSQTLFNALEQEAERAGETISHIVERTLAHELDIAHHSLFQVSTSRALVAVSDSADRSGGGENQRGCHWLEGPSRSAEKMFPVG